MGLLSKYIKLIFKRFNGETVEEYVENVPTVPGALSELNVKLGGNESDIKATDTKVHALGRIYKTLGGTDDTSRIYTTAQMIRKITEVAEQGGGSSDFSTAQVTLITENARDIANYPVIEDSKYIVASSGLPIGQTSITCTVPLYKDGTIIRYMYASATESDIVSGSAEILNGAILMTGDCTIRSTSLGFE